MMIQTSTIQQRLAVRHKPIALTSLMYQKWQDLLFLHWVVDPSILQARLPPGLFVDTFKDNAYLGIIPFFMNHVKPTLFEKFWPGFSFCELNLRTYVFDEKGVPGVWFFSLDASSWIAVQAAKYFFHLPYHYSKFKIETQPETASINYECQRANQEKTVFHYQLTKIAGPAEPNTLEFFLAERYVLFSADNKGRLYKGVVNHEPYSLYEGDLQKWDDNVLRWNGFNSIGSYPDHVMMSKGVDVAIYPLKLNES